MSGGGHSFGSGGVEFDKPTGQFTIFSGKKKVELSDKLAVHIALAILSYAAEKYIP